MELAGKLERDSSFNRRGGDGMVRGAEEAVGWWLTSSKDKAGDAGRERAGKEKREGRVREVVVRPSRATSPSVIARQHW